MEFSFRSKEEIFFVVILDFVFSLDYRHLHVNIIPRLHVLEFVCCINPFSYLFGCLNYMYL